MIVYIAYGDIYIANSRVQSIVRLRGLFSKQKTREKKKSNFHFAFYAPHNIGRIRQTTTETVRRTFFIFNSLRPQREWIWFVLSQFHLVCAGHKATACGTTKITLASVVAGGGGAVNKYVWRRHAWCLRRNSNQMRIQMEMTKSELNEKLAFGCRATDRHV